MTISVTMTFTNIEELNAFFNPTKVAPEAPFINCDEPLVGPWETPGVPEGYDTIVGRMEKRGFLTPENLIRPTAANTVRDGHWCRYECFRFDLGWYKVEAPQKLQDMGIGSINAYPVAVVDACIDRKYLRGLTT